MANPTDHCLCLFARTPERGRVKRRLAAALGEAGALAAHEELLEKALSHCLPQENHRLVLWLTDLSNLPDWLSRLCEDADIELRRQVAGDLGTRMWGALRAGLAGSRRCVLVGSDCPDIDATYIAAAFDALRASDVVLGPARDGGYGLIGLSRPAPHLFDGMRWGDDQVFARTLERTERCALSVACLPAIYDVDDIDDWRRYRASMSAVPSAPETG